MTNVASRMTEYWETDRSLPRHKTSNTIQKLLKSESISTKMGEIFEHPFLPRETIEALQFQRIQQLVTEAYHHVPFYQRKYKQQGFHPNDLKSWKDYHKLPLTYKDELIDAFPDNSTNNLFQKNDLFPTRSSGSSGKTLPILVDAEAILIDTLQGVRQFWLQTAQSYNKDHVIGHVYTVPWWVDELNESTYQSFFVSSLIEPERIAQILDEENPDILSLYPSNLVSLLPHLSSKFKEKLMVVVTHSEQSTRQERDYFAKELGVPVLDEYSSEELTRIALEMNDGQYYICEDTVRLDILDIETLELIENGTGLVVATNLLNRAMPFIRYVQGDCVTIGTQKNSEIHWKQIEHIDGRLNDSFITEKGLKVPAGTILDITYRWMYEIGINIQEFEIIQDAPLHVTVNAKEPTLRLDAARLLRSSEHIQELLQYCLGKTVSVSFHVVDAIKHSGRKRKPIRRTFGGIR